MAVCVSGNSAEEVLSPNRRFNFQLTFEKVSKVLFRLVEWRSLRKIRLFSCTFHVPMLGAPCWSTIPRQPMPIKQVRKTFSAVLTRSGNSLHWVIIRLPFDSAKVWGVRGSLRVKGDINGYTFSSSLFPTGDGHHYMVVNKQMQKGGGVQAGMEARFQMEPDTAKRETPAVPELDRLLRQSRRVQKFYESLSPSTRSDIARVISGAKQPETRRRRAEQAVENLMETMEAEVELPPMIRQFLARNPLASQGWNAMPPSHRRMYLFGIFHYRNIEARLRRIEKAVTEMAEYATRKRGVRTPAADSDFE